MPNPASHGDTRAFSQVLAVLLTGKVEPIRVADVRTLRCSTAIRAVPAIQQLRELHIALTRAVLDAYGWTDFKPTWEFGTPWIDGTTRFFPNAEARAEILARLQVLNHERHALKLDLYKKHDLPIPAASTSADDDEPEEP